MLVLHTSAHPPSEQHSQLYFKQLKLCGPNEIRTRNELSPTPLIKSQLRCQLRHGTLPVVPKGLEPLTPALKERCAHPVAPRDLSIISVLYVFVLSVSLFIKFLCYKYMNCFSNPKIFFNFFMFVPPERFERSIKVS